MIAGRREIAGSDLSCYTIAVAALMESVGLDYELAIGSQLFTAVREEPAGGERPLWGFIHHHTSLRSERLGAPGLVRRSAASCGEAVERQREQVAANGAVIVVGDTFNLPWQNAFARGHAPHWFVIDSFSGDRCHVVDLLAYENQFGVQEPCRGWHPVADLVELTRVADYRSSPWFRVRERHALGDVEEEGLIASPNPYHWYEAVRRGGRQPGPLEALRDTVRHHGGGTVRPDMAGAGWTCGLPALELLQRRVEGELRSPGLYDANADFWVAGRTRCLFARACGSLGAALRDARFRGLAEWCRQRLVWPWSLVPRMMEYNRSALARGRPPRPQLAQLLGEIVAAESELVDRLARLLDG